MWPISSLDCRRWQPDRRLQRNTRSARPVLCHFMQSAGTNSVSAFFVFLNLLKRKTQRFAETRLANSPHQALQANPVAYKGIDGRSFRLANAARFFSPWGRTNSGHRSSRRMETRLVILRRRTGNHENDQIRNVPSGSEQVPSLMRSRPRRGRSSDAEVRHGTPRYSSGDRARNSRRNAQMVSGGPGFWQCAEGGHSP